MRAWVLERPGTAPLRLATVPDPVPGPGELLLEVEACAVCRTDLQLVRGDLAARVLPVVPGHQAVGRVMGLGAGSSGWKVGDRAGVGWLGWTCGVCRFCRSARENLCERARFTGWDRAGGFAESLVVDAGFALHLGDGEEAAAQAPLLCGGVIGFRALEVSGIQPGGRLGLYGFGASARLAIQVAVHWGCEVFVITRSPQDQDEARRLGAVWTGGDGDVPPVPLDAAVTFAPAGGVVVAALGALDRGGVVAVNAIHLDRVPEFSYDLLWWERQLRSVSNYTREDAAGFLELAASIPIRAEPDLRSFEQAEAALDDLEAGRVSGAAVLLARR